MDLATVLDWRRPGDREGLALDPGETWVAGGSWLFSEPQPEATGLVDLTALGWAPWEELGDVLRIGATCTIEQVQRAPWGGAAPLVRSCADSFLMSWKIQHVATVGGNLALGLPAGAMISLTGALGAEAVVWTPEGGERREPVVDLVRGDGVTSLAPGEVIRAVDVPRASLSRPTAFRRIGLTDRGRAGSVVVGCGSTVTVTAATTRPVVLEAADLDAGLDAVDCWFDDPHGAPDWRAHVTRLLAHEVVAELAG